MSVVNANTTDLMCKLLSGEDYLNRATQLDDTQAADSQNLLDFIFHMLRFRLLLNQDESVDFNRRARRFMFKIITKTSIIPRSLIATGVSKPAEQDYIGGGGFGRVYKSELKGEAVALKVLYKSDDNAVSSTSRSYNATLFISVPAGLLSRGIDVGIAQAQIRAAIPGNR